MKEQDVVSFEQDVLPTINDQNTMVVIKDLITHAKSLLSYLNLSAKLDTAKPIPPKPRPDFEKCGVIKKQISRLANECPESEFNIPVIMGRVDKFIIQTEDLERQGIKRSNRA